MIKGNIFLSSAYNPVDNKWSVDFKTGILSRIDKDSRQYRPFLFLGTNDELSSKYNDAIEVENKLYLVPYLYRKNMDIRIVDLSTLSSEYIELENREIQKDLINASLFSGVIQIKDFVFFIPYSYPAIIRMNVNNKKIDYIDLWINELNINEESNLGFFPINQYSISGENIYLPLARCTDLLIINYKTMEISINHIKVNSSGFSCICKIDEENFLLTGAGQNSDWLYLWNKEKNDVCKEWKMQSTPNDYPVMKMLKHSNKDVYIFPCQNWEGLKLDIYCLKGDAAELTNTELIQNYTQKNNIPLYGNEIIYANWISDDVFLYVTGYDLKWHEYNVKTHKHVEYNLELANDNEQIFKALKEYYSNLTKYKVPINERELSFSEYLDFVDFY